MGLYTAKERNEVGVDTSDFASIAEGKKKFCQMPRDTVKGTPNGA